MRERIDTRHTFDTEAALARMAGRRELLAPMAALLVMQWRQFEDQIVKAIGQRDGAALEMAAHRLRESLASIGAHRASRFAQELQVRGRTGDGDDWQEVWARLHSAIDDLANGLTEFSRETTAVVGGKIPE